MDTGMIAVALEPKIERLLVALERMADAQEKSAAMLAEIVAAGAAGAAGARIDDTEPVDTTNDEPAADIDVDVLDGIGA